MFPLVAARWGGPELPLPSDDYRVVLGSGVRLRCSDRLASRLPTEGLIAKHRYQLARNNRNELVISLSAPLADDERTRVAQERPSSWYQQVAFTPAETVLFQSYRGEFATDSQAAIHAELRNRRPELELIWGVTDRSVRRAGGRARAADSEVEIGTPPWVVADTCAGTSTSTATSVRGPISAICRPSTGSPSNRWAISPLAGPRAAGIGHRQRMRPS